MKNWISFILFLSVMSCRPDNKPKQTITESFPKAAYAYVKIYSLDTSYLYEGDKDLITKGILKDFRYLGPTFIDTQGKPIHQQYRVIRLNAQQQDSLNHILRPAPSLDSLVTDKSCVPVFRDVIVFYNHHDAPIAQTQLCFGCEMSNFLTIQKDLPNPFYMIEFDYEGRFDELRKLFQQIGMFVPSREEVRRKMAFNVIKFSPPQNKAHSSN